MADLRINGWSDESLKGQPDLDQTIWHYRGRVDFGIRLLWGALRPGLMSILVLQSSSLSSWCLVVVVWLFLAVPWVCLRFVIVVFSDHTHLLFLTKLGA